MCICVCVCVCVCVCEDSKYWFKKRLDTSHLDIGVMQYYSLNSLQLIVWRTKLSYFQLVRLCNFVGWEIKIFHPTPMKKD